MRLQEMKWPEVKQYLAGDDLIIFPVGSTEQHATHLPLGTDSYEAIGWAEEAAARTATIVAPPLWYGWSPHHMAYPGTLTLSASALGQVVYELCLSAVFHGFSKIIIVNGHRETNLPPLKIAATRLANETGALMAVVDAGYMGGAEGREIRRKARGGVGHADELETSLMLYLQGEELVDVSEARRSDQTLERRPGLDMDSQQDRPYRPLIIEELASMTDSTGALGDPGEATAEKGRRYQEALVQSLVNLIEDMRSRDVVTKRPMVLS
jgi:creatinine amidohydrolase